MALVLFAIRVLAGVVLLAGLIWIVIAQPTFRKNSPSPLRIEPDNLRRHVEALSQTFYPRDWSHRANLDRCADFIADEFQAAGAAVQRQPFPAGAHTYQNIVARFNPAAEGRIIVGAHYDACGATHGADDNASGIAALLELAALIGKRAPEAPIDLVAYCLEEPPFYRSPEMGSAVHAKSVATEKAKYQGVIVLEMVGYFSDAPGSQSYPMPLLRAFYPSRGNFIALASRWDQGGWISAVKRRMKGSTDLPVYSIRAPASVPGIDFSDHMNYWPHGLKALMITDTAFYRNRNYHEPQDTAATLDYNRMGKVVVAVFEAVRGIAKPERKL